MTSVTLGEKFRNLLKIEHNTFVITHLKTKCKTNKHFFEALPISSNRWNCLRLFYMNGRYVCTC